MKLVNQWVHGGMNRTSADSVTYEADHDDGWTIKQEEGNCRIQCLTDIVIHCCSLQNKVTKIDEQFTINGIANQTENPSCPTQYGKLIECKLYECKL